MNRAVRATRTRPGRPRPRTVPGRRSEARPAPGAGAREGKRTVPARARARAHVFGPPTPKYAPSHGTVVCGFMRAMRPAATALLLFLLGCGGGGGGGGGSTDTSFYLVSSQPAAGSQNVPVDSTVSVVLSEAIDPATVKTDALAVGSLDAGAVPGTTVLVDDGVGTTLLWTPGATMAPIASHQCQISGKLRSVAGHALSGTRDFIFRTGNSGMPVNLPPASSLRSTIGHLNVGRRSHTATLLLDGRVLLAGGFTQATAITDTAETYLSETFTLVGDTMKQERAGHTATLLDDGTVLLAGGEYEVSVGQLATTDRAELFLPQSSTFVEVGPMGTERIDHAAIKLDDGRVLITGGSRIEAGHVIDLDSAEIYDPQTQTFSPVLAPMVHTRAAHVMERLASGKIVLVGGSDLDQRPEWFDQTTETFWPLAPPAAAQARFGAMSATFASGSMCVAGGDSLGTVLHVDATSAVVVNSGSGLDRPRAYGTATAIGGGEVLVVGGVDFTQGLTLHTADLVVEGGIAGSRTYGTELLFPVPMALHTATRLPDGAVLFCGGLNETYGAPEHDEAFLFTPP